MLKTILSGLLGLTVIAMPAFAQNDRATRLRETRPAELAAQPLELIVVYPPGGGMDIVARQVARALEQATQQRVIVTNRTGGAGLIGHTWFATQAPATGQVVGILSNNFWTDEMLRANGRWSRRDIDPIAFINSDPIAWFVATAGPFGQSSLADVLTHLRTNPGTTRVGAAPGGVSELLADLVAQTTGSRLLKVPYQGSAPAITAVLGGNLDIGFSFLADIRGHVDAGTIRPIAFAGTSRIAAMPQVPTFNEVMGNDRILIQAWRFVALPKGVPAARRAWLAEAFAVALADPALRAEFERIGSAMDPSLDTPERVAAEVARLSEMERDMLVHFGRLR